jgi:hypothetical protein
LELEDSVNQTVGFIIMAGRACATLGDLTSPIKSSAVIGFDLLAESAAKRLVAAFNKAHDYAVGKPAPATT